VPRVSEENSALEGRLFFLGFDPFPKAVGILTFNH
jgi:hypothetical protein